MQIRPGSWRPCCPSLSEPRITGLSLGLSGGEMGGFPFGSPVNFRAVTHPSSAWCIAHGRPARLFATSRMGERLFDSGNQPLFRVVVCSTSGTTKNGPHGLSFGVLTCKKDPLLSLNCGRPASACRRCALPRPKAAPRTRRTRGRGGKDRKKEGWVEGSPIHEEVSAANLLALSSLLGRPLAYQASMVSGTSPARRPPRKLKARSVSFSRVLHGRRVAFSVLVEFGQGRCPVPAMPAAAASGPHRATAGCVSGARGAGARAGGAAEGAFCAPEDAGDTHVAVVVKAVMGSHFGG